MDAALVKLLVLRLRGGARHRLLELKSTRGILFFCVTVGVIALFLWRPALPPGEPGGSLSADPLQLREQLAVFMPVGLLATCLLTVLTSSGPAIYFAPAEINLLFSGPFTRRALLLYRICFYAFGALLSSLLIVLFAPSLTSTLSAAFIGAFLTLMFIQLFSATIGLLNQLLLRHWLVRLRRGAVLVLLAGLAGSGFWLFAGAAGGLAEGLGLFQSSWAGSIVLAPFDVFTRLFLSGAVYPDLLGWGTLALCIDGGLLAIIILLDGYTDEASIAASQAFHRRRAQARRSGGPLWGVTQPSVVCTGWRLPLLAGIGPTAWRQLLTVARTSVRPVLVFLVVAMLAGPLLVRAGAEISPWSRAGFVFFFAVFVLPRMLVFDFRSDLDYMENLKALPQRPWMICAGQLVTPVLLTSIIEVVLSGSTLLFLDGTPRLLAASLLPFIVPFNLLLYGLENIFFLLFPAPLVPVGRIDFDFLGRTMVEFAVKTLFLLGSCGLAAGLGLLAFRATERSWLVFAVATWIPLALMAITTLPVLSWGFRRFDVSSKY